MAEAPKTSKIHRFFNVFHFLVVRLLRWFDDRISIGFWSFWGSKIDQKSIKNWSKKRSKTRCKLGWILDRSWIDFQSILGPSWGSSWAQVGTKIGINGVPRRCQKIIKNLEPQGYASGTQGSASVPGSWPLKNACLLYTSPSPRD